tara:strand:+ start:1202 stop:1363 length:162 start_codon:yes stop_codon:yes gene_type:complete
MSSVREKRAAVHKAQVKAEEALNQGAPAPAAEPAPKPKAKAKAPKKTATKKRK